jgi:hypothetical protein
MSNPDGLPLVHDVAREPEPNKKKMNIPNLHQPGRPSKKTGGLCRQIVSNPNSKEPEEEKNSSQPPNPSSRKPKRASRASCCHSAKCHVASRDPAPLGPHCPFAAQNTQPAHSTDETTNGEARETKRRESESTRGIFTGRDQ